MKKLISLVCWSVLAGCSTSSQAEVGRGRGKMEEVSATDQANRRLVALGDLHGDLGQAKKALRLARLIDEEGHWVGGDALLVQVGDLLDRGVEAPQLVDFFIGLAVEAKKAGGEVVNLLGNHEEMNLMGDWRYVHPSEIAFYGGQEARIAEYKPGGAMRNWLIERPLVAKRGETIFSHAAVTPEFAALGVEGINAAGRAALAQFPVDRTEKVLNSAGPLWDRTFAQGSEAEVCARLDESLQKLNACRMVVGHTPQKGRITARCGGKLLLIDTGLGHFYGGNMSFLEIESEDAREQLQSRQEDLPDGACMIPKQKKGSK